MPEMPPLPRLEQALARVPEGERPGLLALLEQRVRREGWLEGLRVLRAYRAARPPTPRP